MSPIGSLYTHIYVVGNNEYLSTVFFIVPLTVYLLEVKTPICHFVGNQEFNRPVSPKEGFPQEGRVGVRSDRFIPRT